MCWKRLHHRRIAETQKHRNTETRVSVYTDLCLGLRNVKSDPNVAVDETKRLTVDLQAELHLQLKVQCAQNGVQMVEVLRIAISDLVGSETAFRRVATRVRAGDKL